MGLFKNIFKKFSAVSSTARLVCDQYQTLKSGQLNLSDREIKEIIIKTRYETFTNKFAKEALLKDIDEYEDLTSLTRAILIMENANSLGRPGSFDVLWKMSEEIEETIKEKGMDHIRFDLKTD